MIGKPLTEASKRRVQRPFHVRDETRDVVPRYRKGPRINK